NTPFGTFNKGTGLLNKNSWYYTNKEGEKLKVDEKFILNWVNEVRGDAGTLPTELQNTNNYGGLSAPSSVEDKSKYKDDPDWEYHEMEFHTPNITPSIRGHAAFATDNGIGWARVWHNNKTGAVEVQEFQSDLFQKGRDRKDLAKGEMGYEDEGSP